MWKKLLLLAALGTIAAVLPGSPANAQATRTWVSGVGDDANPCSRTAPCKTWAGAIAKTSPGGEIDALDPGGFGALTITKSITLDGGGGQVASVLVATTNGITVAAGATDVVILRNLRFAGLLGNGSNSGNAGLTAINFISGLQLVIDNCDIFGFNNNGINIALSAAGFVKVRNTTVRNVAGNNGGNPGGGLWATTTSGVVAVQIDNSSFVGVRNQNVATQVGVAAGPGSAVSVTNSNIQNFASGATATGSGILTIENSLITSNGNGIATAAGSTLNISNNGLYNNTTAYVLAGTTTTTGNNRVIGPLGTFSATTMPQD